ncbi:MAG: hypothetical protein V7K25_03820 [Nostoc sp.]|uniref:hypothetical protein n=1 Tax=Nostoc sp. TaxID=1180 RepID=UPI002FF7A859
MIIYPAIALSLVSLSRGAIGFQPVKYNYTLDFREKKGYFRGIFARFSKCDRFYGSG